MPPHLVCGLSNLHRVVVVERKPLAAQWSHSGQACPQCWQAHPQDCGPGMRLEDFGLSNLEMGMVPPRAEAMELP